MRIEDQRKIVARNFFNDNRDSYEDYHEAETEFMSRDISETFIKLALEPYIKQESGHILFMRDDGHVASLRESDQFFSPRTEMTDEEGEELEESFEAAKEKYPNYNEVQLLESIGWRKIID